MAGEGSMLHMINTLKNDRNLRRSKRRKFRNQNSSRLKTEEKPIVTLEISDKKLENIKKEIRARVKKERRNSSVFSITLFSLFGLLLFYFWSYIF